MEKHFKKNILILSILLAFITPVLSGCKRAAAAVEPATRTELVLGTVCTVKIYDKTSNKVMDQVFNRLKEIENKMSDNIDSSEVMSINKAAGINYVKVSLDTFEVIKRGIEYGDISKGKFDISVEPLVRDWGIGTDKARVPSELEINQAKALINYKDILLNETDKKVMLKRKGMAIDLGGIAKGYAADEVERILKENGIKHAIIDLGGNIVVLNSKTDGSPWTIGIQTPSAVRGEYLGTIHATGKSIVTSGIYERYFDKDGKHYHHILDVNTGYPVDNNLASVSIVNNVSMDGDGLSTTVFCMGLEKGLQFVEGLKDTEAIFVTKDNKVYITSGLKGNFKITDTTFKLMN